MDTPRFLDVLKVRNSAQEASSAGKVAGVLFVLEPDGEDVYLRIADRKGRSVDTDSRFYPDPVYSVLRSVERIREAEMMTVNWGKHEQRISLHSNPAIAYQVFECDNVVDERLKPMTMDRSNVWNTTIRLADGPNGYEPSLYAVQNGEACSIRAMLSDTFAMGTDMIIRVRPIGDGFTSLQYFTDTFPKDITEKYMSLIYSTMRNVAVECDDFEVVISDTELTPHLALLIERVDSDNVLYLKVIGEIGQFEHKFLEDFHLMKCAMFTGDREITVRNVVQLDMDAVCDELLVEICGGRRSRSTDGVELIDGNTFIIPEEAARNFLLGSLPRIAQRFRILGAEKLNGYRIQQGTPKLNVRLGSGIDFLEGDATVTVGDESISLSSFLQQYRRDHYIVLSDGEKAIIDETYVARLERLFNKGKKGDKVRVSYFDLPEIASLLEEIPDDGAFASSRRFIEGLNSISAEKFVSPKGFKAELRPYQEEGVKWMKYLYDNSRGGCLADDMGLGKTIQTMALVCMTRRGAKSPDLVVMPKSLIFNWQAEFRRFAPHLKVGVHYGTARNLDEAMTSDVILTTYGMVRNDIESLSKLKFHTIILDESQNIRNLAAQSTQAVMLLQAEHRFALSGTPIENNLSELYSLFRFLNPAMFQSHDDFSARYIMPIQRGEDKEVRMELKRKILPYIMRRTKGEVLDDLPDRTDQTLHVTLDAEHALFYEQKRRYFRTAIDEQISQKGIHKSQFLVFQALSELRRVASIPESMSDGKIHSSKIPVMMEYLTEAVANSHKVVVFFNFIAGIELVGEMLAKEGIRYEVMTGATTDRQRVVTVFQDDPGCKVLLMTVKTGGVGLNLTAADTVFIYEPWWNRAEEEQAIGRLHRIGQKAKVMTFSIVADGTIEEKILLLQQQKSTLIDDIITSDSAAGKCLTEEDIEYLLK